MKKTSRDQQFQQFHKNSKNSRKTDKIKSNRKSNRKSVVYSEKRRFAVVAGALIVGTLLVLVVDNVIRLDQKTQDELERLKYLGI